MSFDLRFFVPSICRLMNIDSPKFATEMPYLVSDEFNGKIKKALIFCPDAFGKHAFDAFPEFYQDMKSHCTHEVDLKSVSPSVTPVCFASLFTGAKTNEHGITEYKKPTLTCDTLFDALIRSGKKVAIVAVQNSSIDIIFRNRPISYYSLAYDPLVTACTLDLIEKDIYDVIVVYHQEYDDLLHETGSLSKLSKMALNHHVESWKVLVEAAEKKWKENFLVSFTPDHGAHDEEDGKGNHGLEVALDMDLKHFFYMK